MNWLNKLKKTGEALQTAISKVQSSLGFIDADTIDEIEELLILADIGTTTTDLIISKLKQKIKQKAIPKNEINKALKEILLGIISENKSDTVEYEPNKLNIIMVVGVNGAGKTTTIGKLANRFANKKVMVAAGDTFRAAAQAQLNEWANRSNTAIVWGDENDNPSSVAYKAITEATANKADILIIDTAGRLQAKQALMDELGKIVRTVDKYAPDAAKKTYIVLDGSQGQNTFSQVKSFNEVAKLSGIIVTKLDSSSKAGFLIGITNEYKIPVAYACFGEKITDIEPFDPQNYIEGLLG
jgi:fused signal recognition particle receptor